MRTPRGRDDSSDLFEFTPPPPRPTPAPDYDHVSRWKEREEKRSKRSDVSPEERRWENRWRAAGERVRTRPPVVATPIPSPPPVTTTPPDELAFRRASLDAAELRNRARRGTAPVDRRASIAEVPTSVPPVPPLTAPLVEISPPSTPPYQVPRLPRVDLPSIETRSDVAPATDLQVDPSVSTPEAPPSLTLLVDPPAPAFAEPIEESFVVPDRMAPSPEVDRTSSEESPPEAVIEAPVAHQAEVQSFEGIDAQPVAAVDEGQARAAESIESKVLPETRENPLLDAEAIAPPSASVLTEPATVSEEPLLNETHAEAVGTAEVITPPPSVVPTEPAPAIEVNVAAETLGETGPIATPSAATLPEPIESPGFVADACLADPDKVILDQTNVDLTTSVHDACGLPRTPRASVSGPSIEPEHLEEPPIAAAQQLGTPPPLADWEIPFETSARFGSGSTAKETTPPPSSRDWPTVRDILASHNASVKRATAPRPTVRPVLAQPILTESREPAHWTFPLWLGWPPALIAVLVFGMAGVALTCIWSVDARWSGSVAALLAGGGANVKPLPESVPTPQGSWWRSSAANLMLWSIYFDRRPADDPLNTVNTEQANRMLVAASQASPIQAQVRFALARRAPLGDEGSSFNPSLGLSRDIEAQTWLGHQWLQRGKKEVAIKVYRRALEMAARVDLSRVAAPAFDEDTQILRYYLPGEELTGRVIRDMADQTKWTFADWKDALPSFAPIPLAAARLLRERGSADADAALDLILTRLDAPRLEGSSASLHLAAQAEAFAFKSNWKEAKTRYQEALEQMPIDAIKRSWWMNLAEIERRLNDDSGRQTALELARGHNANDEISQRAVDLMRFSGTRADKVRAQR